MLQASNLEVVNYIDRFVSSYDRVREIRSQEEHKISMNDLAFINLFEQELIDANERIHNMIWVDAFGYVFRRLADHCESSCDVNRLVSDGMLDEVRKYFQFFDECFYGPQQDENIRNFIRDSLLIHCVPPLISHGLPFQLVKTIGNINGYITARHVGIALPPEHPWSLAPNCKDFNKRIPNHGGITYSSTVKPPLMNWFGNFPNGTVFISWSYINKGQNNRNILEWHIGISNKIMANAESATRDIEAAISVAAQFDPTLMTEKEQAIVEPLILAAKESYKHETKAAKKYQEDFDDIAISLEDPEIKQEAKDEIFDRISYTACIYFERVNEEQKLVEEFNDAKNKYLAAKPEDEENKQKFRIVRKDFLMAAENHADYRISNACHDYYDAIDCIMEQL